MRTGRGSYCRGAASRAGWASRGYDSTAGPGVASSWRWKWHSAQSSNGIQTSQRHCARWRGTTHRPRGRSPASSARRTKARTRSSCGAPARMHIDSPSRARRRWPNRHCRHQPVSTDSRRPRCCSALRSQAETRSAASSPSTAIAISSFRRGALKQRRKWEGTPNAIPGVSSTRRSVRASMSRSVSVHGLRNHR